MSKRKADEEGISVTEKIPASPKDILRCGSFKTRFKYSNANEVSDVRYIGNIPWILIYRQRYCGSPKQLQATVILLCNSKNISPMWKVETHFKIRLISQSQGVDDLQQTEDFCFESENNSCFEPFGPIAERNFVKDDKIKFKVSIEIKKVVGIGFYELDFSKPTNMTDVVLVVEGKKVHVNKSLLAVYSSVFQAMFFSGFKEKNQEEIEMKDVDYDELVDFLTFIHPGEDVPIHRENLEYLLKLADRFDIKKVINLCSKYLMTTTDVSNCRKFEIADKYSLTELHSQVLKSLSYREMKSLREGKDFDNFKIASKDGLIDRLFEIIHSSINKSIVPLSKNI